MSIQPETAAGIIAFGMVGALTETSRLPGRAFAAGREIAQRRTVNAWHGALAEARDDADAMADIAQAAVVQLIETDARVEELEDEVARLRGLLASRNDTIRRLTAK